MSRPKHKHLIGRTIVGFDVDYVAGYGGRRFWAVKAIRLDDGSRVQLVADVGEDVNTVLMTHIRQRNVRGHGIKTENER